MIFHCISEVPPPVGWLMLQGYMRWNLPLSRVRFEPFGVLARHALDLHAGVGDSDQQLAADEHGYRAFMLGTMPFFPGENP